jgi:hypothetical protein
MQGTTALSAALVKRDAVRTERLAMAMAEAALRQITTHARTKTFAVVSIHSSFSLLSLLYQLALGSKFLSIHKGVWMGADIDLLL